MEERNRRRLSDEEIATVKEQILASIYEDIGRSLVKKILWVAGATLFALFTWLVSTGQIGGR